MQVLLLACMLAFNSLYAMEMLGLNGWVICSSLSGDNIGSTGRFRPRLLPSSSSLLQNKPKIDPLLKGYCSKFAQGSKTDQVCNNDYGSLKHTMYWTREKILHLSSCIILIESVQFCCQAILFCCRELMPSKVEFTMANWWKMLLKST